MRFEVDKTALVSSVAAAARSTQKGRDAEPHLQMVRLALINDELSCTGTDLDMCVDSSTEVRGADDGEILTNPALLLRVLKTLPRGANVTIETTDKPELALTTSATSYTLAALPAELFPPIPAPTGQVRNLDAAVFGAALRRVVPIADRNPFRPVVEAVLFERENGSLRLVATDTYRLAVCDMPGVSFPREGQQLLVPARALAELVRGLPREGTVKVKHDKKHIAFAAGSTRVTVNLTSPTSPGWPNYRPLIPTAVACRVTADQEAMVGVTRRVAPLSFDATPLRLGVRSNEVEMSALTQDVGTARETLKADGGTEMDVAFNPKYWLEGLRMFAPGDVALDLNGPAKPALLSSESAPEFQYLLMPVRVS